MPTGSPRPIRAFIVHDNPIFLEGVRSCLAAAEGIFVVGTVDTGLSAILQISQQQPDVLVLGAHIPEINVIETVET